MPDEIIVTPEAEQDVDEAYGWYEDNRQGLGEEFLTCVEASIQTICRSPELYPKVHNEFRRALVRRFPYAVFYEYVDGTVIVYSIFHTSRNPDKWKNRLI